MRNVPSYIHVVACTQEFGIRFLLFSYHISFPCYSCLFPSWELVRVIPDSGREARGWYMVGVYAHTLGEHCPIWCRSIILHKYVYFRPLSLQAVLLRLQFTSQELVAFKSSFTRALGSLNSSYKTPGQFNLKVYKNKYLLSIFMDTNSFPPDGRPRVTGI